MPTDNYMYRGRWTLDGGSPGGGTIASDGGTTVRLGSAEHGVCPPEIRAASSAPGLCQRNLKKGDWPVGCRCASRCISEASHLPMSRDGLGRG
jgi:hypothetical protein